MQAQAKDPIKLLFIINPVSGRGNKHKIAQIIEAELAKTAIELQILYTAYAGNAIELTKEAVEKNYTAVIAVGGDGTVNEVGQVLINTNTALGIIPSGSGNGLARYLGIPLNNKKALQKIVHGSVRHIDTASINGKVFLGTAGIGFDAHVGWKFAEFGKRGLLSYMQISTMEFFKYKPSEYVLEIDGKEISSHAFLISFANSGQFGNNAWIAPDAKIDDGYLNVCILEKFPMVNLAGIIYRLFSKKLSGSKHYKIYKAKDIKVKKGHKLLHLDGEPGEGAEVLHIKVIPNSLKVIC